MQFTESAIKGILREKAGSAHKSIADMKTMLNAIPENEALQEDIELALCAVEIVIRRID